MQRNALKLLNNWNASKHRKPLLLYGARQVGKSYILEQFGKESFAKVHIFNFEKDKKIHQYFSENLDPKKIIAELGFQAGVTINTKKDLVIFDEIQECPKAITSLKYFCEELSELALCAAGSLLGVKFATESAPVGKVDILHLYPMTFEEFLIALGDLALLKAFHQISAHKKILNAAHTALLSALYEYFICGGMPEAVKIYIENRTQRLLAFSETRRIQKNIVQMYLADFAKHSGKINSVHIVSVFENIPSQLARCHDQSTQRYRFKDVIPGKGSFRDLQGPIDWLAQAGLIIKAKICSKAQKPLESFTTPNIFKCYLFDIGILGAMLNLNPTDVLDQNYGIAKGYFAENFVAEQFMASGQSPLYSWSERNSEIEFLLLEENQIVPVEVKAGVRVKAKSLQQYILKYAPQKAKIFSAQELTIRPNKPVQKIPLYLAGM